MFHYSKLDMFANDIKALADTDGYVAEENDLREDFQFPDDKYKSRDSWEAHVNECVQLTKRAEQKLNSWHRQSA